MWSRRSILSITGQNLRGSSTKGFRRGTVLEIWPGLWKGCRLYLLPDKRCTTLWCEPTFVTVDNPNHNLGLTAVKYQKFQNISVRAVYLTQYSLFVLCRNHAMPSCLKTGQHFIFVIIYLLLPIKCISFYSVSKILFRFFIANNYDSINENIDP